MKDRQTTIHTIVDLQKLVAGLYDTIEAQDATIKWLRSNPTYMVCSNCNKTTKLVPACTHQAIMEHDNSVIDRIYQESMNKDAIIERQRVLIHGYGIRINESIDGSYEQQATIDKLSDENGYLRNRLRAIRDIPNDNEMRERLASALYDIQTYGVRIAIPHPPVIRGGFDKSFAELTDIDKLAPLRAADHILDIVRGE